MSGPANPASGPRRLALMANAIRQDIVRMLAEAKSGHPAGSLGLADVFTALYFGVLRHDPKRPDWPDRDRFVLSNGHVCPVLYAALANAGYFPREKLMTLRKPGSPLQGHPHRGQLPGIENSSGPLGQGISVAVGMALVAKRETRSWRVYSVMGDGELNEGQCWEAFMLAAKYQLNNLVAVIDRNNIQIDGTSDDVLPLEPLADKLRSFGWNAFEVGGNDPAAVISACEAARKSAKPTAIIAKTVPGKGVSFMEGRFEWHGKTPDAAQAAQALKELEGQRRKLEAAG